METVPSSGYLHVEAVISESHLGKREKEAGSWFCKRKKSIMTSSFLKAAEVQSFLADTLGKGLRVVMKEL